MKTKVLLIAEGGSTHEGRLSSMAELVELSADIGFDVFKNQWTSSAEDMASRRHAPEYIDTYRKLEYPIEWHGALRLWAHQLGIEYGCSVYLPGDAKRMAPFVDYLKISSFEADDRALVLEACQAHERVIVSTGMQTGRVDRRQWVDRHCYMPWAELHCVSAYPAPIDQLNLRLVSGQGRHDGEPEFAGFSDHTADIRIGAWAVCAGASILETHIKLETASVKNRDFIVSLDRNSARIYVLHVRLAERALGDGIKTAQDAEAPMTAYKLSATA